MLSPAGAPSKWGPPDRRKNDNPTDIGAALKTAKQDIPQHALIGNMKLFRRALRLETQGSGVLIGMEDDFHAFKLSLHHDREKVTKLTARAYRYPLSSCVFSTRIVRELEGAPLSSNCRAIGSHSSPKAHCTHLFDMAELAIAHTCRTNRTRQYDLSISYGADTPSSVRVSVDGAERLRLSIDDNQVLSPGVFHGQHLSTGFSKWAQTRLTSDEDIELAMVMQRAWFVSSGRRLKNASENPVARLKNVKPGSCYGYNPDRFPQLAPVSNAERDFTDNAEGMLAFMERS